MSGYMKSLRTAVLITATLTVGAAGPALGQARNANAPATGRSTVASAATTSTSSASSVAERGLEIAVEADRRDTGFSDSQVNLKMILRNRRGDESTREMRTQVLEVEGDGDKAVIVFNQPRDVKGTAFLSHTHKEGQTTSGSICLR